MTMFEADTFSNIKVKNSYCFNGDMENIKRY